MEYARLLEKENRFFCGHGLSLLALAKGMSALFAKNGFSRPSLGYCGVFRLVLFPLESPPSIPFNWPAHCILLRRGINWPSKWNMRDSLKKKTAFSACDVSLPKPSLSWGR